MKVHVPAHEVEVEAIDLVADETTQVEVQKELAFPGLFKLYVHEMGRTVIRICKIKQENIQWVSNIKPIEKPVADRFVDFAKLEQHFKDATGALPNYKRQAAWDYINALKNEILKQMNEVEEIAKHNTELHKRYRTAERTDA